MIERNRGARLWRTKKIRSRGWDALWHCIKRAEGWQMSGWWRKNPGELAYDEKDYNKDIRHCMRNEGRDHLMDKRCWDCSGHGCDWCYSAIIKKHRRQSEALNNEYIEWLDSHVVRSIRVPKGYGNRVERGAYYRSKH